MIGALSCLWLVSRLGEGPNANWESYRRIESGMTYWQIIGLMEGWEGRCLSVRRVFVPDAVDVIVLRWYGNRDWIDVGFDPYGRTRWKQFHASPAKERLTIWDILTGNWETVRE
jgi:hypothetical protein